MNDIIEASSFASKNSNPWKTGGVIMAAPVVLFVLLLIAWSPLVSVFAARNSVEGVRMVNVAFGFASVAALVAVPVCLVIGIIVGTRKK